ncbi:MAG: sulfur carrier protein ThiS [Polyangiaceae bacterium]
MQLVVNGETRDVGDAKSVRDVVVRLGLTEGPVAVELNREIVPRAEHESRSVNEGDVLEIVHFVGGG